MQILFSGKVWHNCTALKVEFWNMSLVCECSSCCASHQTFTNVILRFHWAFRAGILSPHALGWSSQWYMKEHSFGSQILENSLIKAVGRLTLKNNTLFDRVPRDKLPRWQEGRPLIGTLRRAINRTANSWGTKDCAKTLGYFNKPGSLSSSS